MSARADRAPQRGARSLLSDDVDLPKLLCGFCAGVDFGEGQVVIARGCQLVGIICTRCSAIRPAMATQLVQFRKLFNISASTLWRDQPSQTESPVQAARVHPASVFPAAASIASSETS